MIAALVDLLGKFYVNNDLGNVEVIARAIHAAIPNDLVSLQFLGLVYYRKGRVDEAVSLFDKVTRRRGSSTPPDGREENGGITYNELSATVCYREATRHSGNLAKAWHDLGSVLLRLQKSELAISAFHSSLVAHPKTTQVLIPDNAEPGDEDLAIARDGVSALLELRPDSNEALIGLGRTYKKRRDFAAARKCFGWVRRFGKGKQARPTTREGAQPPP